MTSLRPSIAEVLGQLRREDLLPLEREGKAGPVLRRVELPLPWYVRALSGLGGWAAAGFAFGFIFFLHPSTDVFLVVGLGALGAAVLLRRTFEAPFSNQLALVLALAGEVATLHALQDSVSPSQLALTGLAIELALIALYPDALMRFLATGCAFVAAVHLLQLQTHSDDLTGPIAAALLGAFFLLWQRPWLERSRGREVVMSVAYGLTVSALIAIVAALEQPWSTPHLSGEAIWLVAAVVGGFALVMLRESKARGREWVVALLMVAALGALWRNPGILAASGLMAAGFWRREVKLIALAAAFLLWFGAAFYYHLDSSLLLKSGALVGSGLLFLGLRFYVEWTAPEDLEVAR